LEIVEEEEERSLVTRYHVDKCAEDVMLGGRCKFEVRSYHTLQRRVRSNNDIRGADLPACFWMCLHLRRYHPNYSGGRHFHHFLPQDYSNLDH
jgi:hypothetical protein